MAVAPSTNIGTLIGNNPCVECFTDKEKLALLVYLLGEVNSASIDENLSTYMDDTACYGCSAESQLLDAIISKLWTYYANGETSAALKAKFKCLLCLPDRKLKELITGQVLTYINNVQAPT